MPRISAEARAAAVWRVGGKSPPAPGHLSQGARQVWTEITESRPPDYFRPGSTHLLEQLCTTIDLARQLAPRVQENPLDAGVVGQYLKFTQTTALLSQKLRLSVQSSVHCRNGILSERVTPARGRSGKSRDLLFGAGDKVKW
jgi:hypothetical protein